MNEKEEEINESQSKYLVFFKNIYTWAFSIIKIVFIYNKLFLLNMFSYEV